MSEVFAPLWTSYVEGNRLFVVLHCSLLLWASLVFFQALWIARRDRGWLASRDPAGTGRLASLWNTLRHGGTARRLELRDLYETRASVDSDDLARVANLLLLIGVAGTLWSLFGGARAVQVKPPSGQDIGAAEALLPVLRSFNAFSVTIVSVGLAFVVLVFQRILGRAVANIAFDAAQAWDDAGTGVDGTVRELRAVVGELATSVQSLGPQGNAEWARAEVQKVTAELTANAQAASQQMVTAAGSFTIAISDTVAPLAARITTALGPLVARLDGVTRAFDSSMRSLEVQRELLEKHAATLEAIHGHLGTAELAAQQLRDVPGVVGSSLLDVGKHVTGALGGLYASFETRLEQIFKLHEGAVLTVTTRMRDTESQLAAAVQDAKTEITQYLTHYSKQLSGTVDGMLTNAARASDASVWTPVRRAIDDIGSVVQHTTDSVSEAEHTAVAAVESVQRSVESLGDRARAVAMQLDEMREAMAGMGSSRSRERRSTTVAHWVSTGVLAVTMLVLCALFYTRLGH